MTSRRIGLLAALACSLFAAAHTSATAQEPQRQVELVDGKFFLYSIVFPDHTEVLDLKAWDYEPGSAVSLVCMTPGCPVKELCPDGNCTDPAAGVGASKRAVTDLTRNVRGRKLTPGTELEVRVTDLGGRTKRVAYVIQKRGLPKPKRTCFLPTRFTGEFTCAGPCDEFVIGRGFSCQQLGVKVPSRLDGGRFSVSGRGTRIDRLFVRNVPANSFVEVFCLSSKCPFISRLLTATTARSSVDIAALFKRRRIPAGVTFEVRVNQADQIGRAWLFKTKRRGKPTPKQRCLYPGELDPTTCV